MGFARSAPLLAFLLLPAAASATDLNLGLETATQFDTNVFRTDGNERQDVSFRLRPIGSVSSNEGKWTYNLQYSPTYQKFVQRTNEDNLSHFVNAVSEYALTNKTTVGFTERFSAVQALNGDDPLDQTSATSDNDIRRQQVYTNDAALNVSHVLTPRWVSNTSVSYGLFEGDHDNTVNSQAVSAFQSFNYAYDGNNQFGLGGGFSNQWYDQVPRQPSSRTQVINVFGAWTRRFGESTVVALRGGPAFINTQQSPTKIKFDVDDDMMAGNDDDDDGVMGPDKRARFTEKSPNDHRFTFFGEASVTQRWTDTLNSSLSYLRRESNASGLGSSTILDQVTLSTAWAPTQRLDLSVRGDWARRESATDVTTLNSPTSTSTGDGVDTQRWAVAGRAAYRLTRRTTAALNLRYSQQNTNRSTEGASDFGTFVAILGIRYDFDPWRF